MTVSLDSLDDAVFGAMNGIDFPVERVLDGIDAAFEAGLAPVKVNMVVRRGINESSVVPMARWARETGVILRFIEYMDVGHSNGWRLDEVVPADELVAIDRGGLAGRGRRRRAIAARSPVAGATRDGGGEFGVISSVTQPFCRDCTRARISAEGKLYTCLFAVDGHDLRALLRSGASDAELTEAVARHLDAARRPLLGAALGGDLDAAQDRDVRDGRLSGPAGFSTDCPQRRTTRGCAPTVDARTSWITALTRPPPDHTVGLARRGRQDRRTRDRIKDLRSAAGRFGRFVATPGRSSHHGLPT